MYWRSVLILLLILFFPLAGGAKAARFVDNLCENPNYHCISILKGQTWQSLWPDATQRDLIMRLNRINISLRPGMKVALPIGLEHINMMSIAPFAQTLETAGEKTIIFDPTQLAFGAYDENGRLIYWGPASGGRAYCADIGSRCTTKVGTFFIYRKQGPECKSTKFPVGKGGAPMPYCMFFHGGQAFHGGPNEVPGYNASHGCVRIFVEDAKWLNQNFIDLPSDTQQGTRVIVKPYKNNSNTSLRN